MKQIQKHYLLKFLGFLLLFTLPITIWTLSVQASDTTVKNTNTNAEQFKNLKTSDIGKTAIAITSNLGLRYGTDKTISGTIFNQTLSAQEILNNRELAEDEFIIKNMLATKEYYTILKSDFRTSLKESKNKENSLNSIINQLELRLNIGLKAVENIATQRAIFIATMEKIKIEEEKTKAIINTQFKSADTGNLKASIKKYLELRETYEYFRTHLVFSNKFLEYYKVLNTYNDKLLTALKLNRDIIIKGSYIVIPNSGTEILSDYGLLYTEEEIIEIQKKKELQETENSDT